METDDIIVDMVRLEEELYDYGQQLDNVMMKMERLKKSYGELRNVSAYAFVKGITMIIEQATIDVLREK